MVENCASSALRKGLKYSNSLGKNQGWRSTSATRFMARAATNRDFIGLTSHRTPPALLSPGRTKGSLDPAQQLQQRRWGATALATLSDRLTNDGRVVCSIQMTPCRTTGRIGLTSLKHVTILTQETCPR